MQNTNTQTENKETTENEVVREPIIGKFIPKRKFLNFVSGVKGGTRLLTDTAFIKSEQLTGQIEGVIFKVTICDEGTINFEETDTSVCDELMIKRFIENIDNSDVTGYMHKYIIPNLEFYNKDLKKMYLEVDEPKPINKLFSLFDEIKGEKKEMKPVSEKGLSILDSLFGDNEDDNLEKKEVITEKDISEENIESSQEQKDPSIQETYAQQMFREAFEEMNAEKIQELNKRIEDTEKNIVKYKFDIKQNESLLEKDSENLRVLQTRIETLTPGEKPNGNVFFVSAENKTGIEIDDAIKEAIKKISPILGIKEKVVVKMITEGFYTIKIAKKGDIKSEDFALEKEVYQKLMKLDVTGKLSMVSPAEFEYRGELNWHQLVARMIRLGFEQDPEFNKQCGSNSYEVEKTEEIKEVKEAHEHKDGCGCGDTKCETETKNDNDN